MKLKVACLLATLGCICPILAQDNLPILTNYSGRIHTDAGFFRDDAFKEVYPLAKETVILNTNDYNLFTARLPAMEPLNTKGDDHANDDPLFAKPKIDFTKYMMVAIVRDNMYVPAKITRAAVSNQTVTIEYTEEELGGWALCQQEGGLGMYCAALLPKTDKKIQFKGKITKSTQPEADGTTGFNTVSEALSFLVDCVEKNDSKRLTAACVGRGENAPLIIKQPYAFNSLVSFHQSKGLINSYGNMTFPDKGSVFKLGGHGAQFHHLHIDFVKKGQMWYLADLWNCR